ncbi:MAG: hypothetical protein J0L75_19315, partial [Spirochaetes bacterium]|nr:hypothetical protein [Spirochaetota bacterium]
GVGRNIISLFGGGIWSAWVIGMRGLVFSGVEDFELVLILRILREIGKRDFVSGEEDFGLGFMDYADCLGGGFCFWDGGFWALFGFLDSAGCLGGGCCFLGRRIPGLF